MQVGEWGQCPHHTGQVPKGLVLESPAVVESSLSHSLVRPFPLPCATLPWLGQALPQSLEGPSVPHFCFHSLLGPCLLEAPLTTSASWPGCCGAPSCPQAADLPPRRHVVGSLGLRKPAHPQPQATQAPVWYYRGPAFRLWLSGCAYSSPRKGQPPPPAGRGDEEPPCHWPNCSQ